MAGLQGFASHGDSILSKGVDGHLSKAVGKLGLNLVNVDRRQAWPNDWSTNRTRA